MLPSWKKMGVSTLCRKNPPLPRARTTKGLGKEVEDGPTGTKTVHIAEEAETEDDGTRGEDKGIQEAPHQARSRTPRDSTLSQTAGTVVVKDMAGRGVRPG